MSELDEMKKGFTDRLEERHKHHAEQTSAEARILHDFLSREICLTPVARLASRHTTSMPAEPVRTLGLNLTHLNSMQELDRIFMTHFGLEQYYPARLFSYPTILAETLEQFFRPMIEDIGLSQTRQEKELSTLIKEAEENALKGGGIFGVNLPGRGAYLNGWLFTHGTGLTPASALQNKDLALRIFSTAIHEKLGHGFIAAFSALGKVKTRLGLDSFSLAQRFGLQPAQDPTSSLLASRHNLIFHTSQLLEEGWATWIQNYLSANVLGVSHPSPSPDAVIASVGELIPLGSNPEAEVQSLQTALEWLYERASIPKGKEFVAIALLERYGDHCTNETFRALRYLAGEQLLKIAARNLGEKCVPYAVLIAANVTFDFETLSNSDLQEVLANPLYHPDARLMMLSQINLPEKNNLRMLATVAHEELNMIIPPEIR